MKKRLDISCNSERGQITNLSQMLAEAVNRYGEKTAIVLGDSRLSYAELDRDSNKIASALLKLGVKRGDRVAMLLTNSIEFIITFLGIIKIGAIAALLDTKYQIDEISSIFSNCQPKILVTESPALEPLIPVLPEFKSITHVIDLGSRHGGNFISYSELITSTPPDRFEVSPDPDDIALLSYTSGPANRPHGIMLSHHSVIAEAMASGDGFEQTDQDVVMLYALPMHHAFGLIIIMLTSLFRGSTIVIVPGTGISIDTCLSAIESEKGTMFLAVPYIFALAINIAEREGITADLSSLRLCGSAGAPIPIETIHRFKELYGLDIIDFWGLTEAVAHVTFPPPDRTGKLGSAGKPLSIWKLKVVDDNGQELPPNHIGEILVSGPMMKGYYKNPEDTAKVIKDGWLHTGDMGRIDEDGYLFFTGLKKDMILLKGQNVYPSDIEEVLCTNPKVAEAAVVGIPDRLRGEVVRAIIVLKNRKIATEEEIRQFCQKRMADYKVPRHIIFTDSLPKTASGSVRKEELKGQLPVQESSSS